MGKLLFEIGTEEIPARFISIAISQMEENFKEIAKEYRIEISSIRIFTTPRRLCLVAELSDEQSSEEKLIWGPPAHVAFDNNGNPKEPAYAFAKSQGIEVSSLQIKQKGKGNYVCAVLIEKGRKTEEILPELLKDFFFSLNFPKMMRWGDKSIKFVRPVRWFLALFDERVISFEIEGIKSGETTYGHRFLSAGSLRIHSSHEYEKALEENFVIVDQEKRRHLITQQAKGLAESVEGRIILDEDLLEEVTHLVEYPQCVLCIFSEEYLHLPEELLITVMKDHQRYFAVTDSEGKLKNYFVVVSNTKEENCENIKKGAERVIRARFEDARFYYAEDLKKGLNSLLEGTKGMVYHEKLGSLYDKAMRVSQIADKFAKEIIPQKVEIVKIAAQYCKADLASGVVSEFPELQGIMGSYYAKHAGFSEEVAIAIREHYRPKGFNDEIPSNEVGCILSIADKLDHISSFFNLGEIPSGTEDPFGLRRAANGIIAILVRKKYPITISDFVEKLDGLVDEKVKLQIKNFLGQRFESFLELSNYDMNLVKTIGNIIFDYPLYQLEERLKAVREFIKREDFEKFFLSVKRVSNIIKNYEKIPLNTQLFLTSEEKMLYDTMGKVRKNIEQSLNSENFLATLNELSNLTLNINNFFDNVLVMDKDENIRRNRLALLQELSDLLKVVADLSKLY